MILRASFLAASRKPRPNLVELAESICFASVRNIGSHYEDGPPCRIDAGLHPQDGKHGPQCYHPRCDGPPCRAQLLYLRLRYPTLHCLGVTISHVFLTTFTQFMTHIDSRITTQWMKFQFYVSHSHPITLQFWTRPFPARYHAISQTQVGSRRGPHY